MNDVEFLRQLSDMINAKLKMLDSNPEPEQTGEIGDQTCCQDGEGENPIDRDDIFVPPLQAKIEMMKKLSGVPLKDETLKQSQEQGGPGDGPPSQALELMKQLTMSEMFDDGPMDE